jgi:hypothetical protein
MSTPNYTATQLRGRIDFLRRNLLRGGTATETELDSIAERFKGERSKGSLWAHWAELKAIAIAKATTRDHNAIPELDEDSLEAAVTALADKSVSVFLPSLKRTFNIVPASYTRIELLEGHAWWLSRLEAARAVLLEDANAGKINKHVAAEYCEKCERPLEAGSLDETLKRIQAEIGAQRDWVLANAVAPTAAPADKPVNWGDRITAPEYTLLIESYHRVNYDIVSRLPEPKSENGARTLPRSWAFLFSHQADKERRPSAELMRDRSLASVVAVIVLEAIRGQMMKAEGKVDTDELAQAINSG